MVAPGPQTLARLIAGGAKVRASSLSFLTSSAGWLYLQALGRTSQVDVRYHPDTARLFSLGHPVIYAFWHRYQLLLAYENRGSGVSVLVSRSRDGELIARVLRWMGYHTTRGSSTRGGATALGGLMDRLEQGLSVAVTPDGPRGPSGSVAPGVIQLAQKTGVPIIPCAWAGGPARVLSTWDQFLLPSPFGRYAVCYDAPLYLSPTDDQADARVRRALEEVVKEAKRALGSPRGRA